MKDVFNHIKVHDKEYPFAFNINVLQAISNKYGKKDGVHKWVDLVDPKDGSMPDFDALIFICKECINEGTDMENDPECWAYKNKETQRPLITDKQAARIISAIDNFAVFVTSTIAESHDTGKEKN